MDKFEAAARSSAIDAVENGEGFDFGVFKASLAMGLLDFAFSAEMLGASVADGKQSYTIAVDTRDYGLHTVYVNLAGCKLIGVSVF